MSNLQRIRQRQPNNAGSQGASIDRSPWDQQGRICRFSPRRKPRQLPLAVHQGREHARSDNRWFHLDADISSPEMPQRPVSCIGRSDLTQILKRCFAPLSCQESQKVKRAKELKRFSFSLWALLLVAVVSRPLRRILRATRSTGVRNVCLLLLVVGITVWR